MVKPDLKDYSLDEVALLKAKINPVLCEGCVDIAVVMGISGSVEAQCYLVELSKQVELGQIEVSRVIVPPEGVIGSDEIRISAEDAMKWQPERVDMLDASIMEKNQSISGKSRNTYLRLIRALVTLIVQNEKNLTLPDPKEGFHHNRSITHRSGNINEVALRDLLKAVDRDTPASANRIISEAFDLD